MFDIDCWKVIYAYISNNILRILLSGFTIFLALFVFIVLFGMGNGLKNGFEKEFFQAGALNMYVSGTRTSETYAGYQKGRQINLKNSDLDYVVENYTDKYDYISGEFNQMMKVKFGGETGSYCL